MKLPSFVILLSALLTILASARAQQPDQGEISGRILNPNTGEYLRNARVSVEETGETAVSEGGGEYRLSGVAAGKATIVVTYTGYRSASAVVTVPAGGRVSQDFTLSSTSDEVGVANSVVKLGQFIVSTEREGQAKAIMDQRNSMNVTNTVASDTFGDNAEGNVGEFLKHLPGVELDQFYGEARTVRLGGLGSEYTSVTMDGVALASVDANASASGAARSFTMEMASLNSMESIEVSKTVSADMDANAPAGTINLRTKRAFDRAGRRISWQTNVVAHSEEFNLGSSRGPDEDGTSRKIRPGGILEYSDVFFDRRLGVVINLSESNVYQETVLTQLSNSSAATAADRRPLVPTTINLQHAPRFNKRFAATLTTDYKFSPHFDLGLGLVYNYADLWTPQRTVIFNTGVRAAVVGTDPMLSFTSGPTGTVQVNPVAIAKMGETFTALPRFSYKRGSFELEGKFAYSNSTSWYDPMGRRATAKDTNSPVASGITFRAERSGPFETDYRITQIAGPDFANGASFTTPAMTSNDGRFGRTVFYSGELNALLKTSRVFPVTWKTGMKSREQLQKFSDDQLSRRYDYAPNGGATVTSGAWANYRSPWDLDLGMVDGSTASVSGATVFMPNLRAIGDLFRDRPQDFRQNLGTNADSYYESNVARQRRYNERIDAAYFMGTGKLGSRLTGRAGLRWESTSTDAAEPNPLSASEVRSAGFPVSAAGRATTAAGIDYQFRSRPRVHRTGEYDNVFPSASLKYNLMPNLEAHFGYSSTIRRPGYANLAGVWSINETNQTVTAPNPKLKPEESDNYAARLAYYFEPVGLLAATFTQRDVRNLIITDELTAEEFGYTGADDLANYRFVTSDNGAETIGIRSMEIEYSQNLAFFGNAFKRLTARVSYTRLYAEIARANLSPHLASGGLNYTLGRLNVYGNWNWTDDVNTNLTGSTYRRHRANVDVGGGWRINSKYSVSVSVRNVTNAPYINMVKFANGMQAMNRHEIVGTTWTFAMKGVY